MIEVRDLDDAEIYRFYGYQVIKPLKGYAARKGLRTVALGGLALGNDGTVWGFMDHAPGDKLRALYRYTLRLLAWAEKEGIPEIRVVRNAELSTSERLLRRAGFVHADDADGNEIWVWRRG